MSFHKLEAILSTAWLYKSYITYDSFFADNIICKFFCAHSSFFLHMNSNEIVFLTYILLGTRYISCATVGLIHNDN